MSWVELLPAEPETDELAPALLLLEFDDDDDELPLLAGAPTCELEDDEVEGVFWLALVLALA
ncbi:hypothetical protein [Thermogemmatispora sp.]|uniref:hypothetical protein n=1 Tax=Thermogemmatispora sp. TaxID=1968838 RepID=UPI001E0B3101|nr:hypothetical protein [Thermogemmatispora sp.]MBX5449801.1 hypothetical protein [Thermogemmatispora sp.]